MRQFKSVRIGTYGKDVTFHSTPTIMVRLQASFTASEASLTFVDLRLLAEEINNSQIVCFSLRFQPWFELWRWPRYFFDERCKKTVARTRFWLAAYIPSYHCLILSIHWFIERRQKNSSIYTTTWEILQFDWLRAVVFQLNLNYLHVKTTNLLRVVVFKQ